MSRFFKGENIHNEPARLHKVEEPTQITLNGFIRIENLLVRISLILFIILLFLIFFLICFIAVPPTYGFLWW